MGVKLRTELIKLYDKISTKGNNNLKPSVIRMIDKSDIEFDIVIQLSHSMIATGTSEGQNLTQLAIAIGDRVRNYYHLPSKPENLLMTLNHLTKLKLFTKYMLVINVVILENLLKSLMKLLILINHYLLKLVIGNMELYLLGMVNL
mgnify:CR=1 FL=1